MVACDSVCMCFMSVVDDELLLAFTLRALAVS